MLHKALLVVLSLGLAAFAQDEGTLSGPTSSADAAGYSCDASKCQLPNCRCASTDIPGGLDPVSLLSSSASSRVGEEKGSLGGGRRPTRAADQLDGPTGHSRPLCVSGPPTKGFPTGGCYIHLLPDTHHTTWFCRRPLTPESAR